MTNKYPTFPSILASHWSYLKDEGWRYLITCTAEHADANEALYEKLCFEHGDGNVAIGHCWDERAMAPNPRPDHFSIYIRDVEDQVRDFRHKLANI